MSNGSSDGRSGGTLTLVDTQKFCGEVLYRQGRHVKVHESEEEAQDWVRRNMVANKDSVNPPREGRVRPQKFPKFAPSPPTIPFDERTW